MHDLAIREMVREILGYAITTIHGEPVRDDEFDDDADELIKIAKKHLGAQPVKGQQRHEFTFFPRPEAGDIESMIRFLEEKDADGWVFLVLHRKQGNPLLIFRRPVDKE